jgi:hypothetical protein
MRFSKDRIPCAIVNSNLLRLGPRKEEEDNELFAHPFENINLVVFAISQPAYFALNGSSFVEKLAPGKTSKHCRCQ